MNIPFDESMLKRISAAVDRATGLALQADAASAAKELAAIPDGMLSGEAAAFRDCMIRRFGKERAAPTDFGVQDPWVADLVQLYVGCWQKALTGQELANAEAELQAGVSALLGRLDSNDSLDDMESAIHAGLASRGYFALLGRTAPLRELMVWRKQSVEELDVELPEGAYRVTVHFLDDFVLRGWGHYATCGRRSAGGWATETGLYAVVPAYSRLDDEVFSVRFLAHEAQHFADKQRFAALEGWELEYRAKLAELALATSIQADTLRRMCENRSDISKSAPHPYANDAVIRDLEQRLGSRPGQDDLCAGRVADEQALRQAARALLVEDSQRRRNPLETHGD